MPTRRRVLVAGAGWCETMGLVAAAAQSEDDADFLIGRVGQDPNAPKLGNPEGTAVMVEFMDYNCPLCRKSHSVVSELLRLNPDLKMIIRQWPIFGLGSEIAARAALGARVLGNFEAFHNAAFAVRSKIDEDSVEGLIQDIGLDQAAVHRLMKSQDVEIHLADTRGLANILGFSGTPVFLAGGKVFAGYADNLRMEEIIEFARSDG